MKTRTRMTVIGLVMVTLLLLATGSAAARSVETDFETVVVLCGFGESAREWYEDTDEGTVWHFRNMVYQSYLYSTDDRVAGIATWRGHQDMNVTTGDGRAWGNGIIETEMGTWHVVYTGGYEGWVGTSQGKGHGIDGLQAQTMYYTGNIGGVPPENPCAPNAPYAVMTFTGAIIDHKGN
jgi:hypothetical protein